MFERVLFVAVIVTALIISSKSHSSLIATEQQVAIFDDFGIMSSGMIHVCAKRQNKVCIEYDTIPNVLPKCSVMTDVMFSPSIDLVITYYIDSECAGMVFKENLK